MQQQQQTGMHLLLPDTSIKQEPISPQYRDINITTTPPPAMQQRYTPSPNQGLLPTSLSPNMPMQNIQNQQHPAMMGYMPSVSPLQNNMIDMQFQQQLNQNQFNIPMNCMAPDLPTNLPNQNNQMNNQADIQNVLANNNLGQINELDDVTNANNNPLDSGNMNISSLLNLDSQQINTTELSGLSGIMDYLVNAADGGDQQQQQLQATIIPVKQIQTGQDASFQVEEENMSDSFKQISIN